MHDRAPIHSASAQSDDACLFNHQDTHMPSKPPAASEALLRLPSVTSRLGLGRSAVYELVRSGQLCAPIKLGRASVWPSSAIDAFIAAQINAAKQGGKQ